MLAGAALASGPTAAQAPAPVAAPAPTPAQAQQTLTILQDPQKLAQLVQTLQTIAKAAPASPQPATAAPKPAAAAKPAIVAPNGLGVQLLGQVSAWSGRIVAAAAATTAEVSDAPLLWRALARTMSDPAARRTAADGAWRIALVLICGWAAELATAWALRRPAARIEAHAPGPDYPRNAWELLRRLPYALARLLLALIPVVVFAGIGNAMAGIVGGPSPAAPLVALAAVDSYAIGRAILCVGRALTAPKAVRLRLLPLGNDSAAALMRWFRRVTVIAIVGNALAQIVLAIGLPDAAHDALIRLTALAVAILATAAVIRFRDAAARYIMGPAAIPAKVPEWRRGLSRSWHYIAIAAIVAVWLVSAGGVSARLDTLDFLIGTIAILVGARVLAIVALGALARAFATDTLGTGRLRGIEIRAARYQRVFRIVVIAIICGTAAVMLLQLWGLEALGWFAPGKVGGHLLSAVMTTTIAAFLAIVVWEGSNAVLDRQIDRLRETEPARAVRLRTLLPIVRTGLLWTILIVIGATGLSEIGVNIAPLLAGAGIVGIAVGFGAQTLVHDIITGMFILIENTVQVGDGITTAGLTGTVEQLTIRTLRLRAADGALHIIPFSSVVTITNTSRSGIGNAAVSVTVAPGEDIDRVTATLVQIGKEMRADPAFAGMILGDLDLWGVDTVRAWGATLAGQIPCTVDGHMPVQREFNRRMLKRFAELGIALGGPANIAAPA